MKKIVNMMSQKCSFISLANLFAFTLMVVTVNSTCHWLYHQPQIPEDAMKYRKF